MEGERRQATHVELCQLMDACVEIAHMLPNELERALEKMTSEVNMLIISNRAVHAELIAKLRVAEVRRQREHEQRFRLRLAAWRAACHSRALSLFKEHVASAAIIAPEKRKATLTELRAEQSRFGAERVALLRSLAELRKEQLTRAAGAAKAVEAAELAERERAMHTAFLERLREAEAQTEAAVGHALDMLRARLEHVSHAGTAEIARIVAREAEPLAAERRREAAALIGRIGGALGAQLRRLHERALQAIALFREAGRHLDENSARTDALFAAFKERLHDKRRLHERTDRELEAELDATVVEMRQDATEAGSANALARALELLRKIEDGYRRFGEGTLDTLDTHPTEVGAEMARFSRAVCEEIDMMAEADYHEWLRARRARLVATEAAARVAAAAYDLSLIHI